MPDSPKPGINSWFEDELYHQYLRNRQAVDATWTPVFEGNGHEKTAANGGAAANPAVSTPTAPTPVPAPAQTALPMALSQGDQLIPLRGPALRIAENMTASLAIPVATSQRVMPVKVIDENRRLINDHRAATGESKISYTHLIAWAIVKGLETVPVMNHAYADNGSESFRITRDHVNLGIAVDVAGKDGARSLKVPSIKNVQALNFAEFLAAYDALVAKARTNKLTVEDFAWTTISLTNPGTVGTVGAIPRLMPGQGAIIATGAIDYPPEYRAVPEDTRASLGLSKVMMVTSTYDHRVIQGAESGAFLGRLQALLEGESNFYDQIFADLRIPLKALRWQPDQAAAPVVNSDPMKQAAVARLIEAWRERGHLIADLDPLGSQPKPNDDLDASSYGLTIWDLDRTFQAGSFGVTTLRGLLERLRATYSGKLGVQYMHIENPDERIWLQQRMESSANRWPLEAVTRRRILEHLIGAEDFEIFLDTRFKGHKRFSLEGGEAMIPMIDELLERAASAGVHECVIGMSHRGRLTLLANIVGKSMAQLFSEFEGDTDPESIEGSGDVKYHLGASGMYRTSTGKEITVSVAANPSHLEAVNPVVEGIVRPKQDRLGDRVRERVIPVLVHGDAAMAGQGIVAETLNLSRLDGYTTGGTIHLIVNNQIGFTTNPNQGRSSTYCSDVALMIQAPVFHVNSDDPEACVRAAQLAYDYRQKFHKDVVIDLVCYRKHGHNEGDDPSYTQPLLYRKIREQKPVAEKYAARLMEEGIAAAAEVSGWRETNKKRLYEIYDQAQQSKEQYEVQELSAISPGMISADQPLTSVDRSVLDRVMAGSTSFPADFHPHSKLAAMLAKRRDALDAGHIDWALAETLAFGSLVLEGTPVRLSGQDAGRGTFSQRHVEFHDAENDRVYVPLQHLDNAQARFEVYNSPLSEYAVLGFEFGYSVADPLTLVLWEAQFGDFMNGAQIIIDQFIASAESKWGQPSGLILLLPHGQEGQGPEHSSARLERFLQMSAEGNMQVANCTTPAQYFHLLRRQMHGGPDRRGLRKPLVLMTPKSLLRHPKVISQVDDFTAGRFEPLLVDTTVSKQAVRKILLCTGKIYYDLLAARDAKGLMDTAIVRLEQITPFPQMEYEQMLAMYSGATEVVWVQEEPRNMGAWSYLRGRVQPTLNAQKRVFGYAGRPESASPAPGSLKRHLQEQSDLIEEAFKPPTVERRFRKRLIRRHKQRQG